MGNLIFPKDVTSYLTQVGREKEATKMVGYIN